MSKKTEENNQDENGECIARDVVGEHRSCAKSEHRAERTHSRLAELLLQGIPRLKKLQSEVVGAEREARQRMRGVGFKRAIISQADASFMNELQRLQAEGQLDEFQELSRLAHSCQTARDGLGPLEHECFEAERNCEGRMWDLQKVEGELFDSLAFESGETAKRNLGAQVHSPEAIMSEIERLQNLPKTDLLSLIKASRGEAVDDQNRTHGQFMAGIRCLGHSVISSVSILSFVNEPHPPENDREGEHQNPLLLGLEQRDFPRDGEPHDEPTLSFNPEHQNSLLLGLEQRKFSWDGEPHYEPTLSFDPEHPHLIDGEMQQFDPEVESDCGTDGGIPDLDKVDICKMPTATTIQYSSTESFQDLLTQFSTRRQRMNRWVLHQMLTSKLEATLISLQLPNEPSVSPSPSPWAQLVVAYFELGHTTSQTTGNLDMGDAYMGGASDVQDVLEMPPSKAPEHHELPNHPNKTTNRNLDPTSSPGHIIENITAPSTIAPSTVKILEDNGTTGRPAYENVEASSLEVQGSRNPRLDAPVTILSGESGNTTDHKCGEDNLTGKESGDKLKGNGRWKMDLQGYRKSSSERTGEKPAEKMYPASLA